MPEEWGGCYTTAKARKKKRDAHRYGRTASSRGFETLLAMIHSS